MEKECVKLEHPLRRNPRSLSEVAYSLSPEERAIKAKADPIYLTLRD